VLRVRQHTFYVQFKIRMKIDFFFLIFQITKTIFRTLTNQNQFYRCGAVMQFFVFFKLKKCQLLKILKIDVKTLII
jgi:hypothetical protein